MEEINQFIAKGKTDMATHVEKLRQDLATIRTGRASAQLLENIRVEYYGTPTQLKQMAMINILDARTLEIQPWDISAINDIDKALQKADLGASPVNDGKVVRITLPSMTEDRRKTLAKNIAKMSEDFKVAVRNTRRDILEKVKKAQKAGEVTEDDLKRYEADVQKATDANIAQIDKLVADKEVEIMTV
ncbi:ribosome recycling factor [Candidatus Avelusimicrobium facis]|uniref:ribosome recycling factor n=1 Tax=Candidatus Avelusimicrobium facis TaxID=3416203 RepID=UPI003D0DF10F